MENKKKITLKAPVKIAGEEVCEIEVRRSTIGDEEDALQQANKIKRGNNALTVEMCLISRVSKIPYDALRSMNGPDYALLRSALNELNGVEAKDEEESENPMTANMS